MIRDLMMSDFDLNLAVTAVFVLVLLYAAGRLMYHPMRVVLRIVLHALGGAVILLVFNIVASLWGLAIGVNPVTALTVGIMGIPGLVLLVCLKLVV